MRTEPTTQLSIVVPYRWSTSHRGRILEWTLNRYRALFPTAELIIGGMTSGDAAFCLAECRNNGAARSKRDVLLFADADAIGDRDAIVAGAAMVATGAAWALPYCNFHHLTQDATEWLLGEDPARPLAAGSGISASASYPDSNSGLLMISRANFRKAGRFDERFKGWAAEDQAFAAAATTLVGPPERVLSADLHHLWHPVAPGTTTDNPNYPESMSLWDRYKAATGDPEAMADLVEEWQ